MVFTIHWFHEIGREANTKKSLSLSNWFGSENRMSLVNMCQFFHCYEYEPKSTKNIRIIQWFLPQCFVMEIRCFASNYAVPVNLNASDFWILAINVKKKQWRDEKKTRKSQSKAPIKSSTLIKWVECVRHGSLYGDKKWFCDQGSQKGYWKWHIFIYAIGFRVRFFNPHYRSVICVYSTQRCALGISVSMCHFTVLVKRKRLITFVSYVLQIGGKTMHSHLMSDIKSNKINTKCCPTQYQAK